MTQILLNLIENWVSVFFLWIFLSIFILFFTRRVYSSILDPYVFFVVTAIAPGLAGFLVSSVYSVQSSSNFIKIILIISMYLVYFHAYSSQLKGVYGYKISLTGSHLLHGSFLLVITALTFINIFLNGNFETNDPSLRFAAVKSPLVNYVAISLQPLLLFFSILTPHKKIKCLAIILLVLTYLAQSQIGISKSRFIDLLLLFLFLGSTYNILDKAKFPIFIRNLKLRHLSLKFLILTILLPILSITLLFSFTNVSIRSLLFRFVLSLDSTLIYSVFPHFNIGFNSLDTGFISVFEVWLKPFIKQLSGISYTFDNISEYLTFTVSGYAATEYGQTSWQPNNNLVVDLLVMHGFFGLISIFFIAMLFGKITNKLKKKTKLSLVLYPSYCYIIISPFRLLTDAQAFFVSWVLGTIICVTFVVLFSFLPKKNMSE